MRWSCWTRPAGTRCGHSRMRPERDGWRSPPRPRRTLCCRCWRPGPGCGCSSTPASARTDAASAGTAASGCPSAPTRRAWSIVWPSTGCAGSASTRAPTTTIRSDALTPVATDAGPVALPIDWEAIQWLWSLDGYPSDPAHAQFAGKSLRGVRIWKVGGGAYEPAAAEAAARRQAGEFLAAVAARLRDFAAERGRRGLLVFAIDTELLGHWWSEGVIWLREVLAGAAAAGVRLLTVAAGAGRARAGRAAAGRLDLGRGKGPAHVGLARRSPTSPGARGGSSCGCCGRSRQGLRGARRAAGRARAARRPGERLGLPRQARPGGRLPLPPGHRSRRGVAGGHRLRRQSATRVCVP